MSSVELGSCAGHVHEQDGRGGQPYRAPCCCEKRCTCRYCHGTTAGAAHAPYPAQPRGSKQRRQYDRCHHSSKTTADRGALYIGPPASRRCPVCVPEKAELEEADLLALQQRCEEARLAHQLRLSALTETYGSRCPGAWRERYQTNTSEMLRRQRNSFYQRAVDAEYVARRRTLQAELEARREEIAEMQRNREAIRIESAVANARDSRYNEHCSSVSPSRRALSSDPTLHARCTTTMPPCDNISAHCRRGAATPPAPPLAHLGCEDPQPPLEAEARQPAVLPHPLQGCSSPIPPPCHNRGKESNDGRTRHLAHGTCYQCPWSQGHWQCGWMWSPCACGNSRCRSPPTQPCRQFSAPRAAERRAVSARPPPPRREASIPSSFTPLAQPGLCPACGHSMLSATDVVSMIASGKLEKSLACPSCGFVGGVPCGPARPSGNNNPNAAAPRAQAKGDEEVDLTHSSASKNTRRRSYSVSSAALAAPQFGRKVFITDDTYCDRRARYMADWEQRGIVRRVSSTRSPSAPLPERLPKWRTTGMEVSVE